jgi:hypothetical protein
MMTGSDETLDVKDGVEATIPEMNEEMKARAASKLPSTRYLDRESWYTISVW